MNSGAYKLLLVLHLVGVIAGFGPMFMATAFGAQAKARRGREGLAVAEASFDVVRTYAEWIMYTVPITGILLVLVSNDAWDFSQAWISLGFLLYIAVLAVMHALHFPNVRHMNRLMAELAGEERGGDVAAASGPSPSGRPPQLAELEQRGTRAAATAGAINLILVLAVAVMVWKPGV